MAGTVFLAGNAADSGAGEGDHAVAGVAQAMAAALSDDRVHADVGRRAQKSYGAEDRIVRFQDVDACGKTIFVARLERAGVVADEFRVPFFFRPLVDQHGAEATEDARSHHRSSMRRADEDYTGDVGRGTEEGCVAESLAVSRRGADLVESHARGREPEVVVAIDDL